MKTVNIDTLVVSGTGDLSFTEGTENTPVPAFLDVYVNNNTLSLINALEQTPRPPLSGELKRTIMQLHLLRTGANQIELIYTTSFATKVYTKIYENHMAFKIALSVKKNMLLLKEVTMPHSIEQAHEIEKHLKSQTAALRKVEEYIENGNNTLTGVFNNY